MHKFLCLYNNNDEMFKTAIIFAKDEEHARVQFLLSTDLIDDCLINKQDVLNYCNALKDKNHCNEPFDDEITYDGQFVYIYNLNDIMDNKILNYDNAFVSTKDIIKNKLNIKR